MCRISFLMLFICFCTSPVLAAPVAKPAKVNPFGVMLDGGGMTVQDKIAVAKSLGVTYIRLPQVSVKDWKGRNTDVEAYKKAGFKIILTVRNEGVFGPPPGPSIPPVDMKLYKKTVSDILDKCRPELLVIENEENNVMFYQGTPAEYAAQLKACCEIAHSKGIKCTNGGLVSSFLAAMVWKHYRDTDQIAAAEDLEKRAFTVEQANAFKSPRGRTQLQGYIDFGKTLIGIYKNAGIDYVNFHWYIPDAKALQEAVDYLRSETGLQPITNEIGLYSGNPTVTEQLMAKVVDLKMPYAVWYSLDQPDYNALQTSYGSLRPGGEVFKSFIADRYGKRPTTSSTVKKKH